MDSVNNVWDSESNSNEVLTPFERDKKLVEMFGEKIMEYTDEYRRSLWSFYTAIQYLSDNKINLEFNQ